MQKNEKIKNTKKSVQELIRLALIYAQQDRESYLESIKGCGADYASDKAETEQLINQFKHLRLKRFGKTRLEAIIERSKPKTLEEIFGREAAAQAIGKLSDEPAEL
jgi:bacterioferritin (cytochrome b1)